MLLCPLDLRLRYRAILCLLYRVHVYNVAYPRKKAREKCKKIKNKNHHKNTCKRRQNCYYIDMEKITLRLGRPSARPDNCPLDVWRNYKRRCYAARKAGKQAPEPTPAFLRAIDDLLTRLHPKRKVMA